MVADANPSELTTEGENARSCDLDLLSTDELLAVINAEDALVAAAVQKVIPAIKVVVDRTVVALSGRGRFLSFGAGTSGRLAVLDVVECLPTYGVGQDRVCAFMAGGPAAMLRSQEGAEDDPQAGAREVAQADVSDLDVVLAVSASGRTPWCLGVLEEAGRRGAFTAALTCNQGTPLHECAQVVMDPLVGPEVVAGSTRMKAGTAQKLVLNMISTGVMVRLGHTFGNLMVGLQATNTKLRGRARALVERITGASDAEAVLEAAGWDVRVACLMSLRKLDARKARSLLAHHAGSLRHALGS